MIYPCMKRFFLHLVIPLLLSFQLVDSDCLTEGTVCMGTTLNCCDGLICDTYAHSYECVKCPLQGEACLGDTGCCSGMVCDSSSSSPTYIKCIQANAPASNPTKPTTPNKTPMKSPVIQPVTKPTSPINPPRMSPVIGPVNNPTKAPVCSFGGIPSSMSGNTRVSVVKPTNGKSKSKSKKSRNTEAVSIEQALVKDLEIGDTIIGLDENKQPSSECTVVFKGVMNSPGTFYGNYTEGHYLLNLNQDAVLAHDGNTLQPSTEAEQFDVMTSCPFGKDEAGNYFSPTATTLCVDKSYSWEDYLLIWRGLYKISLLLGVYDYSAVNNLILAQSYSSGICEYLIDCMKNEQDCGALEKWSAFFFEQAVTEEFKEKILKLIESYKGDVPSIGNGFVMFALHRL